MKYIQTKEECEENIKGVCEGCGGDLIAIETVDNAGNSTFWQGCKHCSSFRSGVELKHFKVARKLVEEGRIVPYSYIHISDYVGDKERILYYYDIQTAGLSHTVKYIEGLLNLYKE